LAALRQRELWAYDNAQEVEPNLRRLQHIQRRCQAQGIAFMLYLPPISSSYHQLQAKRYQALQAMLNKHRLPYTDYSTLLPDSLFADADHPCAKGAVVLTKHVGELLKKEN
jgi:hypothetical protein